MALTDLDRTLVQRCLTRGPGAWRDFVNRYTGLFLHVVRHTAESRSMPLRPEQEEDACAEIFVELLRDDFAALRRFKGNSSLATYLTVIARRTCVRVLSDLKFSEAMGHVAGHLPAGAKADAAKRAGADGEARIDDREEVQRLLSTLPERDAEVVRRYHLLGQSYRQIGSELGVPENTIGPTLSRARARMRKRA